MFVLSFRNGDNDPTKNYCDKYYMPLIEIKDFNVLIDKKPFFDQPIKNKQEVYKKAVEMSINDDYAIGNWLDYYYHHKYYWHRFISEKNKGIPQQINFVEQLEEDDGAAMFFISEKQQKNYSQLFFRFINCNKMI